MLYSLLGRFSVTDTHRTRNYKCRWIIACQNEQAEEDTCKIVLSSELFI